MKSKYNKKALYTIFLAILAGYGLSKIFVINGFEQPHVYRGLYVLVNSLINIAKLGAFIGVTTEYEGIRNLFTLASPSKLSKNQSLVNIVNTHFDNVKVRIYSPNKPMVNRMPVMIYFHGGGFIFGNLDAYDLLLFEIVRQQELTAISVDYRLAPENPFPAPTEDAWRVINYVLANDKKLNIDKQKLILTGDSAGGNIVVCSSLRLARENKTRPLAQVLIYPWLQLVTYMPSSFKYQFGLFAHIPARKFPLWYLGITNITDEIQQAFRARNHTLLLDRSVRLKLRSYINPFELIPEKYRKGRDYYESYKKFVSIRDDYQELDEDSVLIRDKNLKKRVKLLFTDRISPLFTQSSDLSLLPKTYMIICEWDSLKDEGLMFAQRLKLANVHVKVAYYETCFHAMINMMDKFNKTHEIVADLNGYLKKILL